MHVTVVIAANPGMEVFAAQLAGGACGVFSLQAGPMARVGDKAQGTIDWRGQSRFIRADGVCWASTRAGPVSREQAIALVGA